MLLLLLTLASAPALVDATTAVPDLKVDLRYATDQNFLKQAVYPAGARCWVLPETAERLTHAAASLRQKGYRMVAWDCYRPFTVQKKMWELFPHKGFVADPNHGGSHHNRGAAVDVSLLDEEGNPVEMPTAFDTFSRASFVRYAGGTESSRAHRDLLVQAMEAAGFLRNPMEWWHFDIPEAIHHPVLDAPLAPDAK